MKLLIDCPKRIIIALSEKMYLAQITRKAKTTSGTTTDQINIFINAGIVRAIDPKRKHKKYIELTEKGLKLRKLVMAIGELEE